MAIIKINNNAIDLDAAEIPNLDAAKITTGQFADAKIADVASSKITGTITPSDTTVTLAKMAAGTDGNLISYDTSGNPVAVATGSDGQVLTSAGAGAVPAFESLPASGKVLQVITATDSSARTTTSTSFVTSSNTLSVSITPSSASNKIFIIVNTTGMRISGSSGNAAFTIYRDAINLGSADGLNLNYFGALNTTDFIFPVAMSLLDSPSTTSATTYQVYFKTSNASNTAILTQQSKGSIVAMEISG